MKKTLFSSVLILSGLLVQAQDKISEIRTVSAFTGVEAHDGINLYIAMGPQKVEVKATSDILPKVETEVENGVLSLEVDMDWSNFTWGGSPSIDVYVTLPSVNLISGSGGSDVLSGSIIKSSQLKVRSSGGADVKLELEVDKLDVNSSGGADTELRGKANNATMDASGGSDIDASKLLVKICDVEASGGADVDVNVEKELTASASGGGDITYSGNPTKVNKSESGGGDISKE